MLRVLTQSSVYKSYDIKYEDEYEDLVMQFHSDIWPGLTVFRIKPQFVGTLGAGKPDMLAFRQTTAGEIQGWYLIEVELSTHRVLEHVSAQIQRFSAFEYTTADVERIAPICMQSLPTVSKWNFARAVLQQPPEIIVTIDRITQQMRRSFANLSFEVLTTEARPFKNELGLRALVVDTGLEDPRSFLAIVTLASPRSFCNILRLRATAGEIPSLTITRINIEDHAISASIQKSRNGLNEILLNFENIQALVPNFVRSLGRTYRLHIGDDGTLQLLPTRSV